MTRLSPSLLLPVLVALLTGCISNERTTADTSDGTGAEVSDTTSDTNDTEPDADDTGTQDTSPETLDTIAPETDDDTTPVDSTDSTETDTNDVDSGESDTNDVDGGESDTSDTSSPPEGCCLSAFEDCGLGAVCVPAEGFEFGRCMGLFPSGCWMDSQCAEGETCEGEQVCPCGASCFAPDAPGTCKPSGAACCGSDDDCDGDLQCAPGASGAGTCKAPSSLEPGACWADDDCNGGGVSPAALGSICLGERVCPCGALCVIADAPGTCAKKGCCLVDSDCPSGECAALGSAPGTCKLEPLADGTCWSDDDCGGGERCHDARVCPCGAQCLLPDAPGQCGPAACKTLDPFGYGLCDMVLGVVFDGSRCTFASGCSCGEDCTSMFDSLEDCEQTCL